jgi:hypothetical protein
MRLRHHLIDICLAIVMPFALPFLYLAARYRWHLRLVRHAQDALGVTVVRNHYYEPVFTEQNLSPPSDVARFLPGLDLNVDGQLAVLKQFRFADELLTLDGGVVEGHTYHYGNQNAMFGQGDADALYSFIRAFKPNTVMEIGCGQSSVVTQLAIRKNKIEDTTYAPSHICFEPFHNGWLDKIGVDLRSKKIEDVDLEIFRDLRANDVVFIDSTHVLRPDGDVEHELLRILPILPAGVLVHIHDIFTPWNYSKKFLREDRRFWTEQYMLEAFLSFNSQYEVMLALHDMHRRAEPTLYDAFPILATLPNANPGSFWIRRRTFEGAARAHAI